MNRTKGQLWSLAMTETYSEASGDARINEVNEDDQEVKQEEPEKLNKTNLVGLRREAKHVLKHYEHDYKNDLGVHLYSAHLMHQINPEFPKRVWTSWPLEPKDVPDPKTSTTYVLDEPEVWKEFGASEAASILNDDDEYLPIDQDILEYEEGDKEDEDGNIGIRTNPDENLSIELDALFKRKIYAGVKKLAKQNEDYLLEPSLDHLSFPEVMEMRIKKKIDQIMEKFPKPDKFPKMNRGFYNWKDVLLHADIDNKKLLGKAENLFVEDAGRALKEFEESKNHNSDDSEETDSDDADTSGTHSKRAAKQEHVHYGKGEEDDGETSDEDENSSSFNSIRKRQHDENVEVPKGKNVALENSKTADTKSGATYALRKEVGGLLYEEMKNRNFKRLKDKKSIYDRYAINSYSW